MKEIKTRDTVKNIRTLDRAANVADKMKNAYVHTKEQTQQPNADSPTGFAVNSATERTQDVTREAGFELRCQRKRLAEKIKAPTSSHVPHASESNPPNYTARGRDFAQDNARRRTERTVSYNAEKETERGVKTMNRGMKQSARASEKTVKTSVRTSVKTAERGAKTAEQTSRTAIKTTQMTAKTAAKTAQATAKTTQRAAQAAKATAVAAKNAAKAVSATVKAIISAIKGLIAAIAAGGWVAVIVVVVILLAAFILCSVFGVFATEESYDGAPSMPEVVGQINAEFSAEFDAIIEANPHDTLVIDNAGSASMVENWNEVLAIYAVLVATDTENPTEVATLDNAKIEKLKTVFWDMNRISYSVNEVDAGTNEGAEESITETVLTITVSYSTAEDMISHYGLSAERAAQMRELLQPEYAELFLRLTGSYADITLSASEIATIMETLPDDLSEERKDVVLTAYALLDKVKYFWGGKSLVLGWDSRWSAPMTVTSEGSATTGTVRPFGLDCSGFVDWVFYNAYEGEYIIGHGRGASEQYNYCNAIEWSSAQPGDLVFYPGCEHVGIVVKNDTGTLTIIHCASGYNNVVMTQHTQGNGFAFAGRPQIYGE